MRHLLHVGCGQLDIQHLPNFFHVGEWIETRYDIDQSVNPVIIQSPQLNAQTVDLPHKFMPILGVHNRLENPTFHW